MQTLITSQKNQLLFKVMQMLIINLALLIRLTPQLTIAIQTQGKAQWIEKGKIIIP